MESTPNRLASESSAYLLQHAHNPVDWYPWGDEALELARRLDRPILLSIGYSACHWCHVMERESFENPQIAALMNESFVCIKVDREERPDIDHVYMKALQGMTGRGGWPMTMFLTPDAQPFYAGTYFPPEDRGGIPGFPRVLAGVTAAYRDRRDDVFQSAGRMVEYLARTDGRSGEAATFTPAALVGLREAIAGTIDEEHGGFGRAPKFPGTMTLSLLMDLCATEPANSEDVAALVRLSLDRMAAGGIRDHLGGGFHRYSVDRIWLVPHFEKMLYDQALLVDAYVAAARFFDDAARYRAVVEQTVAYVLAEMTSPEGGFYSAQDADSEGEEGRYFVWSRAEIFEVLGDDRGAAFCEVYGVTEGGNFEGRNILHRLAPVAPAIEAALAESRAALLERRRTRVPPQTDRKVVADWNGLMIAAMAGAAALLERDDLTDAALGAAAFVRASMMDAGGLYHVHAGGSAKIPAFLDDYAFFGRACLALFALRPERVHFETAVRCAEHLLAEFRDPAGGFFFTGSRNESLVARTSDLHDSAVPAGNSVAAELMLRLWLLTGDDRYREAGESVLERFASDALRRPHGASWLLTIAARHARGWKSVVVGGENEEARRRLIRTANEVFCPGCTAFDAPEPADWSPALFHGKTAAGEPAAAFLCDGMTCSLPVTNEEELRQALRRSISPASR